MRGRMLAAATAALTTVLILGTAHANPEEQEYFGGPGDDRVLCGPNIGGACFFLFGDESSVSIVIRDDTGLPTGGYWTFRDEADADLGHAQFCDRALALPIPAGAVRVVVFIDGPLFGPMDCLVSHTSPGIGLHGTIQVYHEYT